MVRSMYSGVAGMRAHQTSMDTIGNNIANVNTYGFKGSRVTFRDIYYQSLRGASAASPTRGGTNSSQIGVGSQVGSIDIMQSRSSFTQTDMTMDVAIDGEGFFQVMDADGNKYYTRAGQLGFDSSGNLVDSKGNFVLGVQGDSFGKAPGSDKIQVALGSVTAKKASAKETINNQIFEITTSNNTKDGNVGIQFTSTDLEDGKLCEAEVTEGGIVVKVNSSAEFATIGAFSTAVNNAIQTASKNKLGKEHPAGNFSITSSTLTFPTGGLTGEQICSADYAINKGSVSGFLATANSGGYGLGDVGSGFLSGMSLPADGKVGNSTFLVTDDGTGNLTVTMTVAVAADAAATPPVTAGTYTYTGTITKAKADKGGTLLLKNGASDTDYVEIAYPEGAKAFDTGIAGGAAATTTPVPLPDLVVKSSEASKNVGLSSKSFILSGGTEGGPQGIESLSGISIGTDGVITGTHNELGQVKLGRIDVATFANPSGMEQAGSTYFTTTPNSGTMSITKPGSSGSGQLVSGSLELSNVDLSREFTDMIKTQRGYQANSRIITVTDTMLEELVNLKR